MKRRDVTPSEWGLYLLDDVLFLAADQLDESVAEPRPVEVTMRFRIAADAAAGVLEISSDGPADGTLVTTLDYPF